MNSFYYYVLSSLILETFLILFLSYKVKDKLMPMQGMILSMTFSMTIGLTFGVLFGSLHQGNLFYSTIISMFIGITTGLICGIRLGLLPSIEGIMAGLMAGMMGAMLGEMIQLTQSTILLNILLLLSLSSLLLFLILPKTDKRDNIHYRLWFFKPILVMGALSSYLLFGFHLSEEVVYSKRQTGKEHDMDNQSKDLTLEIDAMDLKYNPSSITVKKDHRISLTLNNNDSVEHDIEIKSINIKNSSHNTHHHNSESDLHLHALPNSSSELDFIPLESGEYEFYCTIQGHKEAGMKGILSVISD